MAQRTLRGARVDAKLTQTEAAEKLGVAPSTLRNWEAGRTFPKPPQITKLCALYGVDYDHINFNPGAYIFFAMRLAKS